MLSMPVLKTWLCVLLLLVIPTAPVLAADDPDGKHRYRFGGWTLLLPPELPASALEAGGPPLRMPQAGLEILGYWEDGSRRAIALRFDGEDAKKDRVALRSLRSVRTLKGCKFGGGGRIPALKKAPEGQPPAPTLPETLEVNLPGSDRALRRVNDVLVADLGTARIQLTEDSPVVRLGQWDSADFCRFELEVKEGRRSAADDEDEEELRF